jgi:lipopolysaccharide assembly outer membrane protein LptD (OstA)
MKLLLALLFCLAPAAAPAAEDAMLMGAVVKSDAWKMDRARDLETFTGNVSFKNPRYTLRSDSAVYDRKTADWDLHGSVYVLRTFLNGSQVEMNCDHADYNTIAERALLSRGALPVRLRYVGQDRTTLDGRSDFADASNKTGRMNFSGNFSLSTENLDMYSREALYASADQTFTLLTSTAEPADLPAAVGKREGYDFAIASENIRFFRDSRDIKFYNRVTGWVKDLPPPAAEPER